jgi:hypothetical protein
MIESRCARALIGIDKDEFDPLESFDPIPEAVIKIDPTGFDDEIGSEPGSIPGQQAFGTTISLPHSRGFRRC